MSEQQERHHQQQISSQLPIGSGKRKALIIGISKYDHSNKFSNLDFCENDANEIYSILKDQGYDISSNSARVGRVDWAKMREEIIKFFDDRTLRPEDTLFFYFSGHGYLDRNTNRTFLSTSEIDPVWPALKAIPFDELTTYINYSNSERIVAVLDCCYSGALEVGGKGAEEGEDDDGEAAKSEKGEEIASLANTNLDRTVKRLIRSGQGKCILASSLEEQKSFRMKDEPYSTFTYFLIQGLKGANGESVDSNGYVTPELLGGYVNKKMYELPTIKQKPVRKMEIIGQIVLAQYPKLATHKKEHLLQLLRVGNVEEFNKITESYQTKGTIEHGYMAPERKFEHRLDFGGDTFEEKINLAHVDLHEADVCRAVLVNLDLSEAILNWANLASVRLDRTILRKAKLENTYLSQSNLSYADLSEATLSQALLLEANLNHAILTNAKLDNSVIVGCKKFDKLECSGADFEDAIMDNKDLVDYLNDQDHKAKSVPHPVTSKEDLRLELKRKGIQEDKRVFEKIMEHYLLDTLTTHRKPCRMGSCTIRVLGFA